MLQFFAKNEDKTKLKYLIRARQKLLASLAYIKHMAKADSRVRDTSRRQFYSVAAQAFLKKKHESIRYEIVIHQKNRRIFFSFLEKFDF